MAREFEYGVLSLKTRMHPMLLHLGEWQLDPKMIAFGYKNILEAEKIRLQLLKDSDIDPQDIQVISYVSL